jgi:hypothetical protein
MTACIFSGPSLPRVDRPIALQAVWLPPARHGDVYRAVELLRPKAIGIIDGYFQWVPSVRHQEILWAIDRGVHVFGAASMGALRAAELAAFGMRGVGRIFQAYSKGTFDAAEDVPFEDDDEVAVVHGPAETGYLAVSEAMVNIRCTLEAAEAQRVIEPATRKRLITLAKSMYFPERSYEQLLAATHDDGVPDSELSALQSWLPRGRINQKRADAIAMVDAMRTFLAGEPAPPQRRFSFAETTLWRRGFESAHTLVHTPEELGVLEEARLDGSWQVLRDEVMDEYLPAGTDNDVTRANLTASELAAHTEDPAALADILLDAQHAFSLERLRADIPVQLIERQVLARLRTTGQYAALAVRAADKTARLRTSGALANADDLPGLVLLQVQNWFFGSRGGDIPDDLPQYLSNTGYANEAQFDNAVVREYMYQRTMDRGAEHGPATTTE